MYSDDSMTPSGLRSSWPMEPTSWPNVASRSVRACCAIEILAVGVQHDGELEVEDLADGGVAASQRLRRVEVLSVDDLVELATKDVHGPEHVMLRQRDAHVDAADAAAQLKVLVVPRAAEQPVHPGDQRHLELADARLAADERGARALVRQDARVEQLGDAREVRRRVGVQLAERRLIGGAPVDIALQLFEHGFHRPRILARPLALGIHQTS